MHLIPFAALILVLAGGAGSATMAAGRPSTAKIVVLVVLTLLVERSFLRGNLPSRLADVSEPVGILACWVAAAMLTLAAWQVYLWLVASGPPLELAQVAALIAAPPTLVSLGLDPLAVALWCVVGVVAWLVAEGVPSRRGGGAHPRS